MDSKDIGYSHPETTGLKRTTSRLSLGTSTATGGPWGSGLTSTSRLSVCTSSRHSASGLGSGAPGGGDYRASPAASAAMAGPRSVRGMSPTRARGRQRKPLSRWAAKRWSAARAPSA